MKSPGSTGKVNLRWAVLAPLTGRVRNTGMVVKAAKDIERVMIILKRRTFLLHRAHLRAQHKFSYIYISDKRFMNLINIGYFCICINKIF